VLLRLNMPQDEIYYQQLFKRYLAGELMGAETQELFDYIRQFPEQTDLLLQGEDQKAFAAKLQAMPALPEQISNRMRDRLLDDIRKSTSRVRMENPANAAYPVSEPKMASVHRLHFLKYTRWWAAAVLLTVVLTGGYIWLKNAHNISQPSLAQATTNKAAVPYIRNITLPDGSVVVLKAGSKLDYPLSFSGDTREVTLQGEAYFDIVHKERQPFIIHTGKVKTTVLGTAFNIRADGRQVVVSVTHGKVRVEDDTKVLAILTPDQQVQYKVPESMATQQTVNAGTLVTAWTKEDMVFDGLTFEAIARLLSQRYGVGIRFKNEKLKHCKIRASFSGTERLDEVAAALCGIRNGEYRQLADGTLLLDGIGCE